MPNYCGTKLNITGPFAQRQTWVERFRDDESVLSFEKLGFDLITVLNHTNYLEKHDDQITSYIFVSRWSVVPEEMFHRVFATKEFNMLRFEVLYCDRGWEYVGRYGNFGPHYNFKLSENDFDSERKLLMTEFQTIYDISG